MGSFSSYDLDDMLEDGDALIGEDYATGKTKRYSLEAISRFVRNLGLNNVFGVFSDLDNESTPVYVSANTDGSNQYTDIRIEMDGTADNVDNLPATYGALFVNRLSSPNPTEFDFSSLNVLGTKVTYVVDLDVTKVTYQGNVTASQEPFGVEFEMEFPDGSKDYDSAYVAQSKTASDGIYYTHIKLHFSTYIQDVDTQSLIGGKMGIRLSNNSIMSGTDDLLSYKNIKVTARI